MIPNNSQTYARTKGESGITRRVEIIAWSEDLRPLVVGSQGLMDAWSLDGFVGLGTTFDPNP